jgi:MFS family permease
MREDIAALDSRNAWIAATAALAILTVAHGAPLISAVALKSMAADFGTSRSTPAAASSLAYLGGALGGIPAGWLCRRFGTRVVVTSGGVMVAIGLAVSSLGGAASLYVGHGLLIGLLGVSCMLAPLITYVSLWFDRRRGAAVALISAGQSVSGVVWPLIFDAAISHYGWRTTMEIYALLTLVTITGLAIAFLREPPDTARPGVASRLTAGSSARDVDFPRSFGMAGLMLAIFCCCVPMNMPIGHLVAFCGDLGIGSQEGALMLSVLLGSAFIARQLWGAVADRLGGLKTLLWSSLAQLCALSAFVVTQDERGLFAISSAFGFGFSGLLPAYVITVRDYYAANEASWRVPTVLLAGYVGMAAGGWGAGVLYDHFGFYAPAFAAGILFNLLNLIVLGALYFATTWRAKQGAPEASQQQLLFQAASNELYPLTRSGCEK